MGSVKGCRMGNTKEKQGLECSGGDSEVVLPYRRHIEGEWGGRWWTG